MIIFRIFPKFLIPEEFQEKHAYSLVAFSRKKEKKGSNILHTDTDEKGSNWKRKFYVILSVNEDFIPEESRWFTTIYKIFGREVAGILSSLKRKITG